jgi:PP-loop superfamily ATP-utilizing enzyme
VSNQVLAFSGGWDSTACAMRLWQLGEQFTMLFTATGDELPDLLEHVDRVALITGAKLVKPENRSLAEWMEEFNALPNWRQRWCTRLIKIVPCIAYLKSNPGSTLLVGLRADEEDRVGLYGDWATYRYPLREWGWDRKQVESFVRSAGVLPPARTDCALCYGQRIGEWYALWRDHPERFSEGEKWEEKTGHTFRSAQRDTWPAALKDLRKEFESGREPRGLRVLNNEQKSCRVCRM